MFHSPTDAAPQFLQKLTPLLSLKIGFDLVRAMSTSDGATAFAASVKLPWVPEACLALSFLSYYTPLMSLIFSPLDISRHLTKAYREGTSGTQGSVEQSRQEIMVSHVMAKDFTNRCMTIKWSISFIAIIITLFIYSNKRKFSSELKLFELCDAAS